MRKKIHKRKNPANILVSSPEFKQFIKLLEKNEISYDNIVLFGSKYTGELLERTQYLIDFATIIYFKGLLKGYSKIYQMSRYESRKSIIEDIKNIEESISNIFKQDKIPPYKKIKEK